MLLGFVFVLAPLPLHVPEGNLVSSIYLTYRFGLNNLKVNKIPIIPVYTSLRHRHGPENHRIPVALILRGCNLDCI